LPRCVHLIVKARTVLRCERRCVSLIGRIGVVHFVKASNLTADARLSFDASPRRGRLNRAAPLYFLFCRFARRESLMPARTAWRRRH
jgi:hypothetical protein